ncbi:hypothetical protein [Qaidamihabitans albus]|nr:hypothetical protein [Qaidamihabitans albus]
MSTLVAALVAAGVIAAAPPARAATTGNRDAEGRVLPDRAPQP